ncbi:efflux RND transporter periplasmic adaptor subunit [Robbsia sp. KACC 23696]|uniref:efflux RND transporter periplasmic adaptor subunit n=1 Tax=Robbsia sp. KACC 23696 TaxID=3149231 RepID=UPI00325BBCAF
MSTEFQAPAAPRTRSMKPFAVIAVLLACGVVANGLWSRMHAHTALTTWTNAQAEPTVATLHPTALAAAHSLSLPGQLNAWTNAPLYARVPGYLHAWYADIGDRVKAGQVLARIDSPELDEQLAQARAQLKSAIANQDLARSTAHRWDDMLTQDAVSAQQANEKDSAYTAAQANVAADQANVSRLEATSAYKAIQAPFSGIVTARNTDVGDLITADGTSQKPLFALSDESRLRVYADVPEADAATLRPGMQASITVPEHPGQTFIAKITDMADAIDPSSATQRVELAIDNTSGALTAGAYAQISFRVPNPPGGLTVPSSTLIFRSNTVQVAVYGADGHVHFRDVRIAQNFGDRVALASGPTNGQAPLQRDDRLVNNPPDGLVDGEAVRLPETSPDHATTEDTHG